MRAVDGELVFENLREVFLGEGPHEFRIILDPEIFANSRDVDVSLRCPSGNCVERTIERWGRKMRVSFRLRDINSEGVFVLSVESPSFARKERRFWVIR